MFHLEAHVVQHKRLAFAYDEINSCSKKITYNISFLYSLKFLPYFCAGRNSLVVRVSKF